MTRGKGPEPNSGSLRGPREEGADDSGRRPEAPPGRVPVRLGPAEAYPPPPRAVAVLVKALIPVAAALWALSLRHVHLDRMTSLGLISVLPITYWAALAVLTVGFALALADRRIRTIWLLAYVAALIVVLHGTPAVLYPALRYSWAWTHVSIVSYLTTHPGTA